MEIAKSKKFENLNELVEQIKELQYEIIHFGGAKEMPFEEIASSEARDISHSVYTPHIFKAYGISLDKNGIVNGLLYSTGGETVKITEFNTNLVWALKDYYED